MNEFLRSSWLSMRPLIEITYLPSQSKQAHHTNCLRRCVTHTNTSNGGTKMGLKLSSLTWQTTHSTWFMIQRTMSEWIFSWCNSSLSSSIQTICRVSHSDISNLIGRPFNPLSRIRRIRSGSQSCIQYRNQISHYCPTTTDRTLSNTSKWQLRHQTIKSWLTIRTIASNL